jgi:hypothetical protein
MSSRIVRVFAAAPILGLVTFFAATARADDFRLESATLPAPLLGKDGKPDVVIEASGVEPIGDGRRFLVAHDKHPSLYVVDLATGRVVGEPITSPKFPTPNATGPKWEGMARDSEGNYYIIGAHNGKTDEERLTKSYLLRFRLKDAEGDTPSIDDATVVRYDISPSLVAAMKSQGQDASAVDKRKIEGLAIRESKGRRELAIGLRQPGGKIRAYSADLTSTSPGGELDLKPLFVFASDPREGNDSELTSLEYVPSLGGFLVTTATEDAQNAFHGNTLYFVADGETTTARKIASFEVAMKVEGMAVLGESKSDGKTSIKLLLTYDNDPHTTKIPSRFQTATLVRESR